MRADNYKITQYSVSSILGYVENSQIAIPEYKDHLYGREKK